MSNKNKHSKPENKLENKAESSKETVGTSTNSPREMQQKLDVSKITSSVSKVSGSAGKNIGKWFSGMKEKMASGSEQNGSNTRNNASTGLSIHSTSFIGGLVIGAALFYAGTMFFTKTAVEKKVNGQPIYRQTYLNELEKAHGPEVMDSLVTQELILQAAATKKITVSQKELDAEYKKIADQFTAQNQKFEDVLKAQNTTKDTVMNQLKMQQLVVKLVGNDVKITDDEIAKYIENDPSLAGSEESLETVRGKARDILKNQKVDDKIRKFITDIKAKAQVE